METVRDAHRTSAITLVSATAHDAVRVCEPECRDAFLMDLGLHAAGGMSGFRPRGDAIVTVAWSGIMYHVTWKRHPLSGASCDACGDEWMFRPGRVRAVPPPTEAQLRSREVFAIRVRARARETENADAGSPRG